MLDPHHQKSISNYIKTIATFLGQCRIIIAQPSVTRTRTAGIHPIEIEEFYINPKVYLRHPQSKKKYLVTHPRVFSPDYDNMVAHIFCDKLVINMIHKANIGSYDANIFMSEHQQTRIEVNCLVSNLVSHYPVFKNLRNQAQQEWNRCESSKQTLLANSFNDSKKNNNIRKVFHERFVDLLVSCETIRGLDRRVLLEILQTDHKELVILADFVSKHRKDLRFMDDADIDIAFNESKVKAIMEQ